MGKFAMGQSVPRTEDPRLLTGRGRYIDDVSMIDQCHAFVLRSPHAHARIRGVDIAAAKGMPGVVAIYTGADWAADDLGHFVPPLQRQRRDGSPMHVPVRPALALDRVMLVGDPVAFIVAETGDQARDAAEAVAVDYEPLPVLVATDAIRSGKSIGLPDYRDSNVNNLIDALDRLARLDDVDIVVPGHAGLADQQGFVYFRTFLVALRDRVLDEMVECRTIEEIVDRVTMEDFSDYGNYEQWLRANVVSMWDHLYRQREPSYSAQCRDDYQNEWDARIED